jgi:hypothetical protein
VVPETWYFLLCSFFFFIPVHHHYSLILILTLFTLPPSSILQSIVLPPTTLSAHSHPLFPIFTPLLMTPNLSSHHPSLLHIHHLLTSILYHLYINPTSCNPWHKHYNNRNTPKHTQGPQNPAAPTPLKPPTHPFYCLPLFNAIFINSPKSITNLKTITPSNSNYL